MSPTDNRTIDGEELDGPSLEALVSGLVAPSAEPRGANVNVGMANIQRYGLKKLPCPIETYRKHLGGCTLPYRIQTSKNYQLVAIAQDLLNVFNGHPHVLSEKQIWDFVVWFGKQQLETNEGHGCSSEGNSKIYFNHHLEPWRVCRGVALKKGRLDVVAIADAWILVLLIHDAAVAVEQPFRALTLAEGADRPGAWCYTATGPLSPFESKFPLCVTKVGQRSFARDTHSLDQGEFSAPLCEALNRMPARPFTKNLRAAGFDAGWGLDAGELADLKGLVARKIDSLRSAWARIRNVKFSFDWRVEWRSAGTQNWGVEMHPGSTAGIDYHGHHKSDGHQVIINANNGERNSHTGDVDAGPSRTTVDQARGLVTAERTDPHPPLPRSASGPVVGGNLIARFSASQLGHVIHFAGGAAGLSSEDPDNWTEEPIDPSGPPLPPPIQTDTPPATYPRAKRDKHKRNQALKIVAALLALGAAAYFLLH